MTEAELRKVREATEVLRIVCERAARDHGIEALGERVLPAAVSILSGATAERRDDLLRQLREVGANSSDPERAHGEADDLLLAYVDDPEIAEAYGAITKWYA